MKKLIAIAAIAALCGCSFNSTAPLLMQKDLPLETGRITRQGTACSYYIFGFIGPFGKNSLVAAARDGHISNIMYYDYSWDYWGAYGTRCVEVYGN